MIAGRAYADGDPPIAPVSRDHCGGPVNDR